MDRHLLVQGLRRMIRPVSLDSLAAMSVTCYMFVILCIDSSKSYNDFSFQNVHLYKTKISMTTEKEPNYLVVVNGWLSFAPHIGM